MGTSHAINGSPCQDFSYCSSGKGSTSPLIATVSDGAGSASHSKYGATLITRSLVVGARKWLSSGSKSPSDEEVWSWIDAARDQISHVAKARKLEPRDFAATVVCVLAVEDNITIIHIGDGAAVIKLDDTWQVGSWPEAGEYASTTYFVTDEPEPRLRINRVEGLPQAIALFTDGLERLSLDFSSKQPHVPFFEKMLQPVLLGSPGQNRPLSASLAQYLSSEVVNSRTDDDKSLIIAAMI